MTKHFYRRTMEPPVLGRKVLEYFSVKRSSTRKELLPLLGKARRDAAAICRENLKSATTAFKHGDKKARAEK